MAAITWADVVALAPELATLNADPAQDLVAKAAILAFVNEALNIDRLGGEDAPRTRLARIYLAAHMGTIQKRGGAAIAGPMTSSSRGGISASYADHGQSSTAGEYGTTSYGQLYWSIVKPRVMVPVVV